MKWDEKKCQTAPSCIQKCLFPRHEPWKQAVYARFVQEGMVKEIDDPYDAAIAGAILGSPAFVERIRREFTTLVENVTQRHERVQEDRIARWIKLESLVEAVAMNFGIQPRDILRKGSKNNQGRQMALYGACQLCRGRHSLIQIAAFFDVSPGGLSSSRSVFRKRLKRDRGLRQCYRLICSDEDRRMPASISIISVLLFFSPVVPV